MWPKLCPLSEERSRSPTRDTLPSESNVKAPEDAAESEGGNQPAQVGVQQVETPDLTKKPDEDQTNKPETEQPKNTTPPTPAEESAGSALLRSVVTASKSLEQCASQLETSVSLL